MPGRVSGPDMTAGRVSLAVLATQTSSFTLSHPAATDRRRVGPKSRSSSARGVMGERTFRERCNRPLHDPAEQHIPRCVQPVTKEAKDDILEHSEDGKHHRRQGCDVTHPGSFSRPHDPPV
jgi:hypothetical protein